MSERNKEIPYPGLRPFTAEEKDIFFGRDDHIKQIVEKLLFSQFVAVVGPSGCGKSSLLQAGLIPRLPNFFEEDWRIVQMRPGDNPIFNLSKALLADNALGPERMDNEAINLWENEKIDKEQLYRDELGFINAKLRRGSLELLKIFENTTLPDNTNILIFVDQFEELFRYKTEETYEIDEEFVALLLETIQQQGFEQIYLIIVIRSDFIGNCAKYSNLPEMINESQYLVPRLSRNQCREAIVGPVVEDTFQEQLVNALLNDISTEPDNLPLLQHVIVRMWSNKLKDNVSDNKSDFLKLSDYEKLGGIHKALSDHATEVFEQLGQRDKKITSIMFKQLTEKTANNQNVRRTVSLGVIQNIFCESIQVNVSKKQRFLGVIRKIARASTKDELPCDEILPIEDILSIIHHFKENDCYFFSLSHADSKKDIIIDISHESLIRTWETLKKWIEEENQNGQIYTYVLDTAQRDKDGEFPNLFSTPYHRFAIDWKKKYKPTKTWAERYGGKYDLSMKFLKKSKKHRNTLISIGVFMILMLIGLLGLSVVEWTEANRLWKKANTLSNKLTILLFNSKIKQSSMLAEQNDFLSAKKLLAGTTELENDVPQNKKHARNLLQWYVNLKSEYTYSELFKSEDPLIKVVTSIDGDWIAAMSEKRIYFFDPKYQVVNKQIEPRDTFVDLLFLHPKNQFIAATETGTIKRYSIPKYHVLPEWSVDTNINKMALSPDNNYLAIGFTDGIHLMDINNQSIESISITEGSIQSFQFSPDGKYIASTSNLWDIETGKIISRIPRSLIRGIQYSPDSKLMALWDLKTTIHLLSTASWSKHVDTINGHKGCINDVEFLANGKYLYHILSASSDGTIRMWDSATGFLNGIFEGFHVQVSDIHLSNGHLYAVGDKYELVCLKHFDHQIKKKHPIYDLPQNPLRCAFSSNGSNIIIGFDNGQISVHHTSNFQLIWKKTLHDSTITDMDIYDNYLASISMNKLMINERNTGKELLNFTDFSNGYCVLKFSSDGKYLIFGNYSGEISVLDTSSMTIQVKEKIHAAQITSILVDRNNNIYSSTNEGKIRIWNFLDTSSNITDFKDLTALNMMGAALSDHSFAVIGQNDFMQNVIRLYQNGKTTEIVTDGGTIYRVIFSPDGMQLLTLSKDSTIRFWDLSTYQELFALKLPVKPCRIFNFDYQCSSNGDCWIGAPLSNKQFIIYHQKDIYEKELQ